MLEDGDADVDVDVAVDADVDADAGGDDGTPAPAPAPAPALAEGIAGQRPSSERTPDAPASKRLQVSATPKPSGVTIPSPVTTTRRCRGIGGMLLG